MVCPSVIGEIDVPNELAAVTKLPGLRIPRSRLTSATARAELDVRVLCVGKRSPGGWVARQLTIWRVGDEGTAAYFRSPNAASISRW